MAPAAVLVLYSRLADLLLRFGCFRKKRSFLENLMLHFPSSALITMSAGFDHFNKHQLATLGWERQDESRKMKPRRSTNKTTGYVDIEDFKKLGTQKLC